jgi:hypothetical protein
MAYTSATLRLLSATIGNGPQLWTYSNVDPHTDVDAAGYITDGPAKGLRVNDTVIVTDTDTYTSTTHMVAVVGASTTELKPATLS